MDAQVTEDLPLVFECELISYESDHCHLFGEIKNTAADESILTDGKVDPLKLKPLIFDGDNALYWTFGKVAGNAFSDGAELR